MKRILFIISLLLISTASFAQNYDLECYTCSSDVTFDCSGCGVNGGTFDGIIFKSSTGKDAALYAPIKVTSKGARIVFEGVFGKKVETNIYKLNEFTRMQDVYDFVNGCGCSADAEVIDLTGLQDSTSALFDSITQHRIEIDALAGIDPFNCDSLDNCPTILNIQDSTSSLYDSIVVVQSSIDNANSSISDIESDITGIQDSTSNLYDSISTIQTTIEGIDPFNCDSVEKCEVIVNIQDSVSSLYDSIALHSSQIAGAVTFNSQENADTAAAQRIEYLDGDAQLQTNIDDSTASIRSDLADTSAALRSLIDNINDYTSSYTDNSNGTYLFENGSGTGDVTVDTRAASNPYTPSGTLVSTNVQAAIDEIEAQNKSTWLVDNTTTYSIDESDDIERSGSIEVTDGTGIGKIAPDGQLQLRYNTGLRNIIIDTDNSNFGTTANQYQVSIGYVAGQGSIGNYNTSLGFFAGYQEVGSYISSIGRDAGRAVQGSHINAFGLNSCENAVGSYINALGNNSAFTAQTLHLNAFGFQTGYQFNGEYGNLIGYFTGYQAQGDNIDAIGQEAARGLQGDFQIAIGYRASYLSTIGDNAIRIGFNSGRNETGNYENTTCVGENTIATADNQNVWGGANSTHTKMNGVQHFADAATALAAMPSMDSGTIFTYTNADGLPTLCRKQ